MGRPGSDAGLWPLMGRSTQGGCVHGCVSVWESRHSEQQTIGTRVIFAREQVRSSRMHAGIQGEVKTLMPGLCSRGYSTLTTWSVDRLHLNHSQNAFEMLASEANGGLFHHQSTRPGLVLEATCVNDLGYNYLGKCINAECSLLV